MNESKNQDVFKEDLMIAAIFATGAFVGFLVGRKRGFNRGVITGTLNAYNNIFGSLS